MSDIEAAADLSCPFCREPDFDAVGLKVHLSMGDCEAYESTPSPARTVRLGSPALAHATRGEGEAIRYVVGQINGDWCVVDSVASEVVERFDTYDAAYAKSIELRITPPPATGEGFAGLPVAYQSSSIGAPPWAGGAPAAPKCGTCDGSGEIDERYGKTIITESCPECVAPRDDGVDNIATPPPATGEAKCPVCRGTGKVQRVSFVDASKKVESSCSVCHGSGTLGPATGEAGTRGEVAVPAAEPCLADDPVVANLRAAAEIQGRPPTWGEIRYLLAHIDGMRGYAETGKDVEGVLIQANLDDFEQTPGETVLWLIDRICSAETALFLGANDPDIERSAVGDSARAHFKKYPNGIHKPLPATREAEPDPRGEDREAARGEGFGGYERERAGFDAWWADKSDGYKVASGKGANLYGIAWDAYYARALRTAERGEGGR